MHVTVIMHVSSLMVAWFTIDAGASVPLQASGNAGVEPTQLQCCLECTAFHHPTNQSVIFGCLEYHFIRKKVIPAMHMMLMALATYCESRLRE